MDININKEGFNPNNIVLEEDELVVWHNIDNRVHNVRASDGHSFNSADINPGDSYQFKLHNKGIYGYYDGHNPNFQGEISVENIPEAD